MKPTNVAIRADASPSKGSGHVMRCLAIAQALKNTGAHVHFICREIVGELPKLISAAGYQLSMLEYAEKEPTPFTDLGSPTQDFPWESDANACLQLATRLGPIDLLIVDHYELDYRWQSSVRLLTDKVLAIDDLANRKHDADILIDHNYGREPEDYKTLCPPHCQLLIGPTFALLRDEFSGRRQQSLVRRQQAKRPFSLLLSLGGGDHHRIVDRVIELTRSIGSNYISDLVVVDPSALQSEADERGKDPNNGTNIIKIRHTTGLAELMQTADLAIGAGGVSSLERCVLGLPSLVLVLAENQRPSSTKLANDGHLFDYLKPDELSANRLIDFLSMNQKAYQHLSQRCSTVTDGLGVQRVLEALEHDS